MEGVNAHQDAAGGAQVKIRTVALMEAALELHTARDFTAGNPQRRQLLQAQGLDAGGRGSEEIMQLSDHVAPDAFLE